MLKWTSGTVCAGMLGVVTVLMCGANAEAQRLPETVRPEHYALRLTPDLNAATFRGEETIDVMASEPVDSITLNALEIKFDAVTTMVAGKELTATVTEDPAKEQVTFHFGQKLPAGKLALRVRYTGILNDKLRGFYLSKTAKRNYAVTQFESTDARRAFPSFDEPAFKATYAVTLVVDKGDTAISNTNIVKDEPVAGDKHAITFAPTPKMSTYLVAFLVGDFECVSGESDGVPIRACATPGQAKYGKYALSAAEFVLHYYDTYFGIKYPMPKLDMIALPDFEAGAMENFGAITYRETDMLLDDSHASVDQEKEVAAVVAHEMAHQWFGDMVTMQWWDNIWLNEGFATWMEHKPVEAWKPEWNIAEDRVAETQSTLNYDAQRVTRTIRAKADTPDEINQMFDGISYGKAGAVLAMVEHYVGEETFRQGVHAYLSAHMYGNATAEDFWGAQTRVSHKPVDKIMESLVAQPGVPMLSFGAVADGKVAVTQERFFLNGKVKAETPQTWTLPVCFKAVGGARCDVLSEASQTLEVPAAPFLFANAGGASYYRVSYPAEAYQGLLLHAETDLTPEERISLIGDEWALSRAGKATVGDYLDLVRTVSKDQSPAVLQSAVSNLSAVNNRIASTGEEHAALDKWVREQFGAAYKQLGEPEASDTPAKKEMRALLLGIVAGAEDADAIAQARTLTARWLADQTSVENTLAREALFIAAAHGDTALFDQLQKLSTTATDPQLRENSLYALATFRDPVLAKRALDFAVSGQVRNQDAFALFAVQLQSRHTREAAWQYIQQNWDKVAAQLTTSSGSGLVGSTASFCSADKLAEVQSFFATHKVAASEHALTRASNQIRDCIDLREAQEGNLKAWLAKQ